MGGTLREGRGIVEGKGLVMESIVEGILEGSLCFVLFFMCENTWVFAREREKQTYLVAF